MATLISYWQSKSPRFKVILLTCMVAVVGIGLILVLSQPSRLLLDYSIPGQRPVGICNDRILVYWDGSISYLCDYQEVARDHIPDDLLTQLREQAQQTGVHIVNN